MNRKTPNLDPRSSVTPDVIDLKFGRRDYVVGPPNMQKLRTIGPAGTTLQGVKCNGQEFIVVFFW